MPGHRTAEHLVHPATGAWTPTAHHDGRCLVLPCYPGQATGRFAGGVHEPPGNLAAFQVPAEIGLELIEVSEDYTRLVAELFAEAAG